MMGSFARGLLPPMWLAGSETIRLEDSATRDDLVRLLDQRAAALRKLRPYTNCWFVGRSRHRYA